ncbi:hypothetical protein D3C76_1298240 [compost metagenome]
MTSALQFRTSFEKNIQPLRRNKPTYRDQLWYRIIMRNRLKPLLIKSIGNHTDDIRFLHVGSQITTERIRHRQEALCLVFQLTIYRKQESMLRSIRFNASIKD